MKSVMQNVVTEWSYITSKNYSDPFNQLEIKAEIIQPDGVKLVVPGFWGGNGKWVIRYSSSKLGLHKYRTICSDATNSDLNDREGEILVVPYEGTNHLYRHGAIRASGNKRYLQHEDGTPFFWLGDTWWMGFTKRLSWPDGFQELTRDRVNKGYSVIQIVAGLYPDMEPFDERGANEAGYPWDKEFKAVNPDYFDMADLKIRHLVNSGLVPCIVACWGFFLEYAGKETIQKHWKYLLARYGAYPVVWCTAGEATMSFYKPLKNKINLDLTQKRKIWTEICAEIHQQDPYGRLLTIHPVDYGHKMVEDDSVLDLEMLQTGHSSFYSLKNTVDMVRKAVERKRLPVINSEVCYEGICGSNYQDIQRFVFWASILNGSCGHTYGANGIWQVNSLEEPYGPSPHGATWGDTPWEEAYKLPGSEQVALGKKLIEKYEWWKFEIHPEWVEKRVDENNDIAHYAAGIPGKVRMVYIPFFSGFGWGEIKIKQIEKDVKYRAYYFDPITGNEFELGEAVGDENGNWTSGRFTKFQDWLLVMEKI